MNKTSVGISLFSTICHHKWNGTKIKDIRKLGNFKKIPEMLGFDGLYPAVHPEAKIWRFLVKNCKRSAVKHSTEKPILLNFVNLSPTLCPRLWLVISSWYLLVQSRVWKHWGKLWNIFKVFIVNFEQISNVVPMFSLLTSNK